ncbi:hypothetical protein Tco_0189492 [Tanacetum coccineum]
MTKTKRQQEQERIGYEAALRLQEQLDEEKRQRIARAHEVASSFNIEEWEDIRVRIEADEELAHRLQVEEREKYSEAKKARLLAELINQRKRHFAQQRVLKKGGPSHPHRLNRELISTKKRVNTFTPMESDVDRTIPKIAVGSTKRAVEEELGQQSSKKQKSDELSQKELQKLMIIVPEEGMNIEALQTKYPIIDFEVYTEDSRISSNSHGTTTEDKDIGFWVSGKMFKPNVDDELWKSQKHIHDITWRLYDTCRVHHVSTKDGMDIYMLVEREYPLPRGVVTQMLVVKLLVEQDNEIYRELLRKIFMQIEKPRR